MDKARVARDTQGILPTVTSLAPPSLSFRLEKETTVAAVNPRHTPLPASTGTVARHGPEDAESASHVMFPTGYRPAYSFLPFAWNFVSFPQIAPSVRLFFRFVIADIEPLTRTRTSIASSILASWHTGMSRKEDWRIGWIVRADWGTVERLANDISVWKAGTDMTLHPFLGPLWGAGQHSSP